jgi:polar amino acid transport system substrate-binding protein
MKPLRAVFALLLVAGGASVEAAPLRICYEDIAEPPWSKPDGTGLNLDLMREVAQHLDEQLVFQPKPWSRCFEELRWGDVDAVLGGADSPERRAIGALPMLPNGDADPSAAVNEDRYYVYLRAGSGASWDGKKLVIPKGGVIVPRGYHVARVLRSEGYPVDEVVKTAEEAFRLLESGKADAAVLFGQQSQNMARDPRFAGHVIESPIPYATLPFYLIASHVIYSREPQRIEALWKGIREVRATPEYREREKTATQLTAPLNHQ